MKKNDDGKRAGSVSALVLCAAVMVLPALPACGQKGPLYLPPAVSTATSSPTSAATASSANASGNLPAAPAAASGASAAAGTSR